MKREVIRTNNAPLPVGPYNQAVKAGNFVFCAGQIPLDPKTGVMLEGNVSEQTRLVLNNLKAVLEASGSSLKNIVKTTVFLKDMNTFADMNKVYTEFFADASEAPARSTIEVARLPKDAKVEIEAVALAV